MTSFQKKNIIIWKSWSKKEKAEKQAQSGNRHEENPENKSLKK